MEFALFISKRFAYAKRVFPLYCGSTVADRFFGVMSYVVRFVRKALCFSLLLYPGILLAQSFETAALHPEDAAYHAPSYPLVFVSAPIVEVPNGQGGVTGAYHLGADVLAASNPSGGNALWILLPDGNVKKLFPLREHVAVEGLIDSSLAALASSSVVEPNLSLDGQSVYFSFFHNADDKAPQSGLPKSGADLYKLDLTPLLEDFEVEPHTLPVQRLTFRPEQPPGGFSQEELFQFALNPTLAGSYVNNWGTVNMHAIDIETASGKKLLYVSNERRLQNSNRNMDSYSNNNFNLYIADIEEDGSLSNARQFQYYTTTSALSPNRLRNGFAFSYQASTEDGRHWQLQGIDSAGKWYPLIGYGVNPGLFHLATFCVRTTGNNPGDYLVGTRYYNLNNKGFGSLWTLDLSKAGQNTYDQSTSWAIIPRQVGSQQITHNVSNGDDPSPLFNGAYNGKFTTPRCARADELFFSYTPTSANGRLYDAENNKHRYRAYIGYRSNLEVFNPLAVPSAQSGIRKVISDSSESVNLLWPLPVLSWQERTGDATQQYSPPVTSDAAEVLPGEPYAEVGTSALWNTDRKPFDCWLSSTGNTPYSPNKSHHDINQENDLLVRNTDGLTYVQDQNDFCKDLTSEHVFGIGVYQTSNKIKTGGHNYETFSGHALETTRLLGIYSVVGQADQSFKAKIPSNVPFEFDLIGPEGLRLTDVRSWHGLQPQEKRTDCGGCHDHRPGKAISFSQTVADQSAALDMVGQTTYIEYDAHCSPTLHTTTEATMPVPEWKADIWPGFDSYCGSCHNTNFSNNTEALAALEYADEQEAYNTLRDRNYAAPHVGGLGSPAFWAARGKRTDGRDNNLAKYAPDYAESVWGYRYSSVHTNTPGLCDGTQPEAAKWVYRLGLWIDHHMPRNTSSGVFDAQLDRFHPTVDVALSQENCGLNQVRVGYWDDSGMISRLEVSLNDQVILTRDSEPNGSFLMPLQSGSLTDRISLLVEDPTGNRQFVRKGLHELAADCEHLPAPPQQDDPASGVDPGNDPGVDPETLMLSLNKTIVQPGERLTFTIEASSASSAYLMCSTSTGSFSFQDVLLSLGETPLLQRTLLWEPFTIVDQAVGITLRLPAKRKLVQHSYSCQAVTGDGALASNLVSFTVKKAKNFKKVKTKYSRQRQKRNRLKKRCLKKWKKAQLDVADSQELSMDSIPLCQKFLSKKSELLLGKAFKKL